VKYECVTAVEWINPGALRKVIGNRLRANQSDHRKRKRPHLIPEATSPGDKKERCPPHEPLTPQGHWPTEPAHQPISSGTYPGPEQFRASTELLHRPGPPPKGRTRTALT
jgi:hypothetical protein